MENNRSMGMVIIERTYSKDGAAIKVMLTQSAGGGANNPLSALGAISQMGMMGGGRKVRLHGHTGTVMPDNNSAKLMVKPRSGEGMISFESRNVDIDAVISFAKAFMKGYGK